MTSDKAQIFAVLISSIIGPIHPNQLPVRNNDTLAPHPVYFSINGRPSKANVIIDDVEYYAVWEDNHLSLEETVPKEDYTGIDLTIDNGAYILKLADGGRVYLPVQWTVIQVIDGSVDDIKKKRK